jgi:hypothetical protein
MTNQQWLHFGLIAGYGIVIWFLWHTPVLFPFKLVTIYIHELSHALAGWLTGGRVKGIAVHTNEGGVTLLEGGKMWLVLPAGYLGSAIFGSLLILMGTNPILSQIAAGLLIAALALAIWWANNWLTRLLTIAFMALTALLWWFKAAWLPFLINFIGTMSALYAIYDIYDDTIRRSVPESDASLLAKHTGVPALVWGIIWCLFSIVLLFAAIYFGVKLTIA